MRRRFPSWFLASLSFVLLLVPLLAMVVPVPRVYEARAAQTTIPYGFTSPNLGEYARGLQSTKPPTEGTLSYQIQVHQNAGSRWVRVWATFDQNLLVGQDIVDLYNAGVRNFLVLTVSHQVHQSGNQYVTCSTDTAKAAMTLSNAQNRLTMNRGSYGALLPSLISVANSGAAIWFEIGNEPNVVNGGSSPEADQNCDGTLSTAEMTAYVNDGIAIAKGLRTWLINQGMPSSQIKMVLAGPSFSQNYDSSLLNAFTSAFNSNPDRGQINAIDTHVYDDVLINVNTWPINAPTESYSVRTIAALRSAIPGVPIIIGEQNINQCFGYLEEGSDPVIRRPGLVKGSHNRRAIQAYAQRFGSSNILAVLIYTTGIWHGPTGNGCTGNATAYKDSAGNALIPYFLDQYHLAALAGEVDAVALGNAGNYVDSQNQYIFSYYRDGAQSSSLGGSSYIYGSIRGWWKNPSDGRWYLVTQKGLASDKNRQFNYEIGILRAQATGLISTTAKSGYVFRYTLGQGGTPIYVYCPVVKYYNGVDYCVLSNGQANPFDPNAVIRDAASCPYFDDTTHHQICGDLYSQYWSKIGRERGVSGIDFWETVMLIGRPLSGHFQECQDGVCDYVQYFERGMMIIRTVNNQTTVNLINLGNAVDSTTMSVSTLSSRLAGVNHDGGTGKPYPTVNTVQCGLRYRC